MYILSWRRKQEKKSRKQKKQTIRQNRILYKKHKESEPITPVYTSNNPTNYWLYNTCTLSFRPVLHGLRNSLYFMASLLRHLLRKGSTPERTAYPQLRALQCRRNMCVVKNWWGPALGGWSSHRRGPKDFGELGWLLKAELIAFFLGIWPLDRSIIMRSPWYWEIPRKPDLMELSDGVAKGRDIMPLLQFKAQRKTKRTHVHASLTRFYWKAIGLYFASIACEGSFFGSCFEWHCSIVIPLYTLSL